jgi:hypothetical protein
MTRKCNCCKELKPIEDFCKNKRGPGGINRSCKYCNNKRTRKEKGTYWKEELKFFNNKYCPKCDTVKSMGEFSNIKKNKDGKYGLCKICKSESDKKFRDKLRSKGIYKERRRKEYLRNYETYKKYTKNRVRDYKKEYSDLRKSVLRTFKYNLRNRLYQAFKYRNMEKNISTSKLLGCTFEEAKIHIELQFKEGMTWDNYGEWHIDHIIPFGTAKTKEEMISLCYYKNLQPLWAHENYKKGCRI